MEIELALVICKESIHRERVSRAAAMCGLNPICCSNLDEARTLLIQADFRLILCEDVLPDGDFHMALREVKTLGSRSPLVVLTEDSDWETYLNALAAGVFDRIVCPASLVESERIVRCALEETASIDGTLHMAC